VVGEHLRGLPDFDAEVIGIREVGALTISNVRAHGRGEGSDTPFEDSIWEGEAKNLEESVREAVAADPDLRPGVYRTLNTRVSRARFVYFTVWINHGEIVRLEHHGVDRP
jgi:hypothetical protein